MKKLFKCTEIHVQDLANGKAWVYVRLHDKASLAKLYITEQTAEEWMSR